MSSAELGVRWTIGDVSEQGYEALRYSIAGAQRLFGESARYAVCVNSVPLALAKRRIGAFALPVQWVESGVTLPAWLSPHVEADMAEGVAWKFAPLRVFPDRHELSLDNDCILWRMPSALSAWLDDPAPSALVAEDVRAMFGQFADACGTAPRNLGIRGLPPGFDLEGALRAVLRARPITLRSELDEQGLQLCALLGLSSADGPQQRSGFVRSLLQVDPGLRDRKSPVVDDEHRVCASELPRERVAYDAPMVCEHPEPLERGKVRLATSAQRQLSRERRTADGRRGRWGRHGRRSSKNRTSSPPRQSRLTGRSASGPSSRSRGPQMTRAYHPSASIIFSA